MKCLGKLCIAGLCSVICVNNIGASEFDNKVKEVFKKHHLIKMVDYDLKTSNEQVKSAEASLYPTLSLKASYGNDKVNREIGKSGSYNPSKLSIEARQLIYDFGLTREKIDYSKIVESKEKIENELQRQNLLLAAIESQLELIKYNILLEYSKKSESNIRQQTKLEDTRLKMGKGYTTDVLQAKAQLSGAEAKRLFDEGQKKLSEYRYKAVFLDKAANIDNLVSFTLSDKLFPKSIKDVEDLIKKQNLDVIAAEFRAKVANSEKNIVKKEEYAPTIYADLSRTFNDEQDGVDGKKYESKALISLNWSFNLGMKGQSNINASKYAALSAYEKAEYVKVQALEDGRRAWNNYLVAKNRTKYLENQVMIQREFLRLAREERELGRRSLIDILNGETALVNAKGEFIAAKIEESISSFKLLRSVGLLNLKLFETDNIIYLSQNKLLK